MRTPHLLPALLAVVLAAAAAGAASRCACRLEDEAVHAVARRMFLQKSQGIALQAAAFRQADLLPLYGGSEIITSSPYDASTLFQDYPEGFTVFPVGLADNCCLTTLQKLAAIGAQARGKKLVISVTPISFYNREMVVPENYAGNFSRLHANALAFSTSLPLELRRQAARRMLDYPATLRNEPLLRFALKNLAAGSPLGSGLYYLTMPLGKLQTLVLRLQDHWETCVYLREHGAVPPAAHPARPLDWRALEERSAREARQYADNNPYGFAKHYWLAHERELIQPKLPLTTANFAWMVENAKEWSDLDLLLWAVNELGGHPLVLSTPILGRYYDFLGIDAQVRAGYYVKLSTVVARHSAPLRSFQEHDGDADFVFDHWGHMHGKGWVHYDQALVEFFCGNLR